MTTMTETNVTTQVYRVYIRATPDRIFDAITKPEWSAKYGYGGTVEFDLRRGGAFRALTSQEMRDHGAPDVGIDGEVIEVDPPRKLVLSWRMVMDEGLEAEGFTRLTYEIEELEGGVSKLTLVHELEGAPRLAALLRGDFEAEGAGGGWSWVLSDLKTLLETGHGFQA
jgi:uncharacterized protein YndB with AHSA1/START domain